MEESNMYYIVKNTKWHPLKRIWTPYLLNTEGHKKGYTEDFNIIIIIIILDQTPKGDGGEQVQYASRHYELQRRVLNIDGLSECNQ